jgi:hypothetical protein
VQWYTGPEGDQRIWYDDSDIESIMRQQLRAARQRLTLMDSVPDLEAFVENYLGVDLDQYADLPPDVLGLTEFSTKSAPRMFISATLTASADESPRRAGMRGRWRATLAHEAAHVVLHRYLFDADMAPIRQAEWRDPEATQGASGALPRIQCLHRDVDVRNSVVSRGSRDWREIQANRGMASLLMPESIFGRVATFHGGDKGSPVEVASREGSELIANVSAQFDVSREAAKLRLIKFEMVI